MHKNQPTEVFLGGSLALGEDVAQRLPRFRPRPRHRLHHPQERMKEDTMLRHAGKNISQCNKYPIWLPVGCSSSGPIPKLCLAAPCPTPRSKR